MEKTQPVGGPLRRAVPLFRSDRQHAALSADMADAMFDGLVSNAVPEMEGRVSLHSCRIRAAVRCKALGKRPDEIQAHVRWKTPESTEVYARTDPAEYADTVRRMMGANTEGITANMLPTHTYDDLYAELQQLIDGLDAGRVATQTC